MAATSVTDSLSGLSMHPPRATDHLTKTPAAVRRSPVFVCQGCSVDSQTLQAIVIAYDIPSEVEG